MKKSALLLVVLAAMGCHGQPAAAPTVTRAATNLEEFFVTWLEGHGEKQIVIDQRGVGLGSSDVRLNIKLYDSKQQKDGGFLVEVEFKITLLGDKEIVEHVAGIGKDEQAAIKDGQLNFMLTTFHVIYKGFMNADDPHQIVEPVEMANGKRDMIMGDILTRGQVNLKEMREKIKAAVAKLKLSPGPHWIKLVYSRINNEPNIVEALVDNQVEASLTQAIKELAWPASEKVYMCKQFIVIK